MLYRILYLGGQGHGTNAIDGVQVKIGGQFVPLQKVSNIAIILESRFDTWIRIKISSLDDLIQYTYCTAFVTQKPIFSFVGYITTGLQNRKSIRSFVYGSKY